jgi:hypothetical protein
LDVRGIYGKLSKKSKFLESGLNGGVILLEGSSAIQVKSGLENQNIMPLKGHEFCDNWCSDNHGLLNYVMQTYLYFSHCLQFLQMSGQKISTKIMQ